MLDTKTIKQREQAHMDYVEDAIQDAIKKNKTKIKKVESDEQRIQDDFKNNVRIKTGTYSGQMETGISIHQQQQLLAERQNNWKQASHQLNILDRLRKKPYFARIDLQEKGSDKVETIYIGLSSFTKNQDEFLIYDWRAPISSVYYDGGLGKVSYDTPDGLQEGDLKLKRQFVVEDGTIVTVFDTDETVGDQMLLEVLDESSSTKMKSIVTTIQKEQNEIIRDTKSDLLFVQGAAGSGKTSAVLQRVAYLLYRYRGNLNSGQIILFSPNQLFNDYIDRVLPELGEHNMIQMTYYQFTQRRIPKIHVETLQERFEEDNTGLNAKIKVLKDSLSFFEATNKYANYLNKNGVRFRTIKYKDREFISKKQIKDIYYSFNNNYNLLNRLDATKEQMARIMNNQIKREAKREEVQKAIQDLSPEQLNVLYGNRKRNSGDSDKELLFLAQQYVERQYEPIKQYIKYNRFFSINKQYIAFLKAIPQIMDLTTFNITNEQWNNHVHNVIANLKNKKLSVSDTTAYLYLYDRLVGRKGDTSIKYIFIDEIQDYTAYQLSYMRYNFPNARFTMLGDLNQAIFTKENSCSLLSELNTMFKADKTKVVQLTQSYRSTQQITDFTKEVLVNGEKVTAFERKGELPEIMVRNQVDELVVAVDKQLKINSNAKKTTAIIAKSLDECHWIATTLANRGQKVTLIETENQRLVEGTIVVPSYLAKGLEFDAIIMWNADDEHYHDESERQLVYTICSRAMHKLNIYAVGKLSRLFDRIPTKYYLEK